MGKELAVELKETDTFLYFAYGSNMSAARLCAADRTPSANFLCRAHVAGYRLAFDKVSKDGSGKADCERTDEEKDVVYGALFQIAQSERRALDKVEGAGKGYAAVEIGVTTSAGVFEALTFLASRKDPTLKPYSWYVRHVLVGAKESALPEAYIDAIERAPTVKDVNLEREAKELAAYAKWTMR
ncbi:MAG: gamma-glutamylcyclotransferase [Alcaligenaceae bacterium]|nr:MAG: gamma-glutamylcyclotransferase [Alcaligenaceae bacterium]